MTNAPQSPLDALYPESGSWCSLGESTSAF